MMATALDATPRRTTSGKRRKKRKKNSLWIAVCLILALVAAVAIGLVCMLSNAYRAYVKSAFHLQYYDSVMTYAEKYDISPSLIYAVIRTESNFDPNAHSSADAKGLMQLTDETLEWVQSRSDELEGISPSKMYDPDTNIHCGVYTLSLLMEMFESTDTVIAAYNAGLGNVQNWLGDPAYSSDGITLHTIPYGETREYVQRVRTAQEIYQTYYGVDERLEQD